MSYLDRARLLLYITVFDGTEPPRVGGLPAFAIAWLPNVVLAVASVILFTVCLKGHAC